MIHAIRRVWRRAFPPKPIRLPGKFPWVKPKPLAFGTVLIEGNPPVIADGKGGVTVEGSATSVWRSHQAIGRSVFSRRPS